ncbi:MAG: hypothetical protein C4K60_20435 [Ideonella sp. MAG2]|nr:MAG: hypothetical protein C4K60_20435 [Ideonella sp. MAG2]
MAIAAVTNSAGAWRATRLGARASVDTIGLGAADLPTQSGRGAGTNAAVLEVTVATSAGKSQAAKSVRNNNHRCEHVLGHEYRLIAPLGQCLSVVVGFGELPNRH